ncbi:MAG: hypothetical protein ACRD07_13915 [Acidimicrobiales bacterium]
MSQVSSGGLQLRMPESGLLVLVGTASLFILWLGWTRAWRKSPPRLWVRVCVNLFVILSTVAVVAVLGTSPSYAQSQIAHLILALLFFALLAVTPRRNERGRRRMW